jgi:hypothetical protein
VQALHGWGGVGKTQIAVEYTHRFAADYEVVWWLAAERAGLIREQVAALAGALGCASEGAGLAEARRAVTAELRERGGGGWCSTTPRIPARWRGGCRAGLGMC